MSDRDIKPENASKTAYKAALQMLEDDTERASAFRPEHRAALRDELHKLKAENEEAAALLSANADLLAFAKKVLDEPETASNSHNKAVPIRRVYVASSWRNEFQPVVVERLRVEGFEVYDFKDAGARFHWRDIDSEWESWTPEQMEAALQNPIAEHAYSVDFSHLEWCDAAVYVQPCGVSASLELGWAAGSGRKAIALVRHGEPELMLKMADLATDLDQVVEMLRRHDWTATRRANNQSSSSSSRNRTKRGPRR